MAGSSLFFVPHFLVAFLLSSIPTTSSSSQCLVCPSADACAPLNSDPVPWSQVTVRCPPAGLFLSTSVQDYTDNNVNSTDDDFTFENTTSSDATGPALGEPSNATLPDEASFGDAFVKVQHLNLSHNALQKISGSFDSLTILDLSHNSIGNLSDCQFHSPKLAHLIISSNDLQSLSGFSHSELEIIDAECNKLTELRSGKLPKLRKLNLGQNRIARIDPNFVGQVPKLEILNLSSNALAQLNDYDFNMTSLLRLHLSKNQITYLSEKCFYGLVKLQFLDISDNQITTVFPSMFQYIPLVQLVVSNNPNLMTQDFGILLASERLQVVNASQTNQARIPACLTRSVRYLALSWNKITQIQCGDLDSYTLLNTLDLAYNEISYIEDDALGRLELLETLVLSYNHLTSIPYTLSGNLKSLHLDHNHLNRITPTDFTGLAKLRHLDLSSSNVTAIADGSLSQMYGLVSLNISMNPIEVASISTFAGPHKLKILDLSWLVNVTECKQDLCFPVPEPNELSELYLAGSPELGRRLMKDAAALKTFKQLNILNIENCNLTNFSGDISTYFPRLRYLYAGGNELNCSEIQEMYEWSDVTRHNCTFSITEETGTTVPTVTKVDSTSVSDSNEVVFNHTDAPEAVSDLSMDIYIKNDSIRYSQETEVISNEIWIADDALGEVDAYSAEAPSSHPGLFILLLLPVALAGAVLLINYSRLKRRLRVERHHEMDIEISNISSELW
ncbi:Leucine Rich Repeat [Nesidiocoris tenuis]|uniref:Leucine Rich Repeat n=1 Tax=Nesidiocoris tenuis TaxID=355587 RepID=A0ABN7AUL5_9HEMI|nr:Leucine Rich Repeat [Nesidiocoris tenuis]